ncbi:MAG: hypothetical protein ACKVW3_17730 [Phycisphaerales bacterium]
MIFFVIYAVVAWYWAARCRRSWRGVAVVIAAASGLALVAYGHWQLNLWTDGKIYFRVLQGLLYPYAAMVVVMAGFIVSLPRAGRGASVCARCEYDLAGLSVAASCPECGLSPIPSTSAMPRRREEPARAGRRSLPIGAPAGVLRSADQ